MRPLAGMFSSEAQAAIAAEEAADMLQHEQSTEQATRDAAAAAATAAETSTAEAATATVEAASADADVGSVGLPAQHGSAERVPPEAAAQEDMDPEQESVRQTRRSPTRASTPSGAASRAARGGKAAGTSPPATQADLRAVQVTLALLIAGHTTEIEQLQSTIGAIQATVVGASSDMDDMRAQVSSYSDAMTASEDKLISMMSPLIDETHTTAERLTELDLLVDAMRIEIRQRPSPQQYDVHTPNHPGRTVGHDDPWQPRPEAGRQHAPRAPAAPSAGGLGHDSTFASAPPTMGTEQRQPQFPQQEFPRAGEAQEQTHFVPPAAAPSTAPHNTGGPTSQQPSSYGHGLSLQKEISYIISTKDTDGLYKFKGQVADFENW